MDILKPISPRRGHIDLKAVQSAAQQFKGTNEILSPQPKFLVGHFDDIHADRLIGNTLHDLPGLIHENARVQGRMGLCCGFNGSL